MVRSGIVSWSGSKQSPLILLFTSSGTIKGRHSYFLLLLAASHLEILGSPLLGGGVLFRTAPYPQRKKQLKTATGLVGLFPKEQNPLYSVQRLPRQTKKRNLTALYNKIGTGLLNLDCNHSAYKDQVRLFWAN